MPQKKLNLNCVELPILAGIYAPEQHPLPQLFYFLWLLQQKKKIKKLLSNKYTAKIMGVTVSAQNNLHHL